MHKLVCHQRVTSPKSSGPTYLQYITVQYIQYITLQYITLHYSKVQYITLHYSTLHYSTVQYIAVHYITYMQRTWCTKSYVTRGAQVLSHQNVHTYFTLHYNTIHYITLHNTLKKTFIYIKINRKIKHKNIYLHFSIYLLALKLCLDINRRKNENHNFSRWAQS